MDIKPTTLQPISKVFFADYQKVWSATLLALEDYPIETENNEKGYLKTENILNNTIWKFPFDIGDSRGSAKYTINIKLVKGTSRGRPVVKVLILKRVLLQKGFISDFQRVPSYGLEEKNILYRISREVSIDKAITNYYKKSS